MNIKYYYNDITNMDANTSNDFYQYGLESGTDKISHHGYHFIYPKYISQYKNIPDAAMIEIGIERKCSLQLWKKYFPSAFIYGIDINISDEGEQYKIFKADQSDITQLNNVNNEMERPVFFVIDDGSHIPEHQIVTFNVFFEKLLPGGTYIIEDIETSYWTKEGLYGYNTNYGYRDSKTIVAFFKLLVDDVNSEFLTNENKGIQTSLVSDKISDFNRKNISTITFAHNCIIITKKTKEETDFYGDREYRFKDKL